LDLSIIVRYYKENMALDPQGYVVSLQNNIRSRPIPWEGAVRAKQLSEDAYAHIKAIDKVRTELRCQALDSDEAGYVSLFLGGKSGASIFQQVAKRQEILHHLLVLFGDAIQGTITT
jgi:V-type H+-transporting ATPase subunit H